MFKRLILRAIFCHLILHKWTCYLYDGKSQKPLDVFLFCQTPILAVVTKTLLRSPKDLRPERKQKAEHVNFSKATGLKGSE